MTQEITEEMKEAVRLKDRPVLLARIKEELKNPYFEGKSDEEVLHLINSGWKVIREKENKVLKPKLGEDGFQMVNERGALLWDKVTEVVEEVSYVDAPVFRVIAGMHYSFNIIKMEDLIDAKQVWQQ